MLARCSAVTSGVSRHLVTGLWFGLCVATLASSQAQMPDPMATRKYSVALGFQKKKLYDQAAGRWQAFIKAYPKSTRLATAHHHLGVCQIQQEKFSEAAATFRTLLGKFPKFASLDSAQFNLGLALYNAALKSEKPNDFKQAVAAFAVVPAKYGNSQLVPAALYYQAECTCLAGDLNGAVPVYQKLVGAFADSPLQPQAHYALGATLQDLQKDAEAEATFKAALQKFAQDPLANDWKVRLGVSLFNQQKYSQAEPLFAQAAAVADFASADFALMKYAQTLFEQGKVQEAAAQYESLPKKFAESQYVGAAHLAGGKCRYRGEELPQAQADFTAAVSLQKDEAPEAAYWLGRTLVLMKRPQEAIKALDQAIGAYPKSEFLPLCKYARIDAIFAVEARRQEAVPLFAQFAAQNAQHEKAPESLYRAALGALHLGDHVNAQKYSQNYIGNEEFMKHELAPDVLLTCAESYLRAEHPDPAKAEALYRRLVGQHAQHEAVPRAQLGIGACLHAAQKYDPAVAHLTQTAGVFKDPVLLAESRLLIGRSHLEAKRAQQAVAILRSALAAKPDWEHADEILFMLAVSLRGANDLANAIAELNRLNSAHPKSTYRDQALYQLGEIYFQQQKYDESIHEYQRVVSEQPASGFAPAALYGLAAAHFEKSDYKAAVASLNTLIGKHAQSPATARGKYLRGMAHLRLEQYKDGVSDLKEFIATKPPESDSLGARFALSRCQIGLGQHAPAIAEMSKLIAEKPEYERADDVHYELGFAYLATGKPKEAADAFRTLAEKLPLSPRAAESWYRVGEYHESQAELPAATIAYEAGLKGPPEPVREKLFYKLGSIQHRQGQYPAAVRSLEAQLKEFANGDLSFAAMYLAGECLFAQKKFDEALTRLNSVTASNDEKAKEFRSRALYRSGICAATLKQWAVSQQHYKMLIDQFPKFELIREARYGLGVALQSQQKLNEARAVLRQVTETEPDSETAAKSWFMMGQCWFAEKKYTEAIDCFSEVAFGFKHEEWQPLSYFEAGRCYVQLKDTEAARKMLTEVVEQFPKHARANDAKTILAQLDQE